MMKSDKAFHLTTKLWFQQTAHKVVFSDFVSLKTLILLDSCRTKFPNKIEFEFHQSTLLFVILLVRRPIEFILSQFRYINLSRAIPPKRTTTE